MSKAKPVCDIYLCPKKCTDPVLHKLLSEARRYKDVPQRKKEYLAAEKKLSSPAMIERMNVAVTSDDDTLRLACAARLIRTGQPNAEEIFLRFAASEDSYERAEIAPLARCFSSDAVFNALLELSRDADICVRSASCEGMIGKDLKVVIPILLDFMKHDKERGIDSEGVSSPAEVAEDLLDGILGTSFMSQNLGNGLATSRPGGPDRKGLIAKAKAYLTELKKKDVAAGKKELPQSKSNARSKQPASRKTTPSRPKQIRTTRNAGIQKRGDTLYLYPIKAMTSSESSMGTPVIVPATCANVKLAKTLMEVLESSIENIPTQKSVATKETEQSWNFILEHAGIKTMLEFVTESKLVGVRMFVNHEIDIQPFKYLPELGYSISIEGACIALGLPAAPQEIGKSVFDAFESCDKELPPRNLFGVLTPDARK